MTLCRLSVTEANNEQHLSQQIVRDSELSKEFRALLTNLNNFSGKAYNDDTSLVIKCF